MNECPYLEINSSEVRCKATNWGRGLNGQQKYGPLPRSMIIRCSGSEHTNCTMYRRKKKEEEREQFGEI